MITQCSLDKLKTFMLDDIKSAKYKINDDYYSTPIYRKEERADGKIAVYFFIQAQNVGLTVSIVQLLDADDQVLASKNENILLENVSENVLYMYSFEIKEA